MDSRFAYVWQHFCTVYRVPVEVVVGYGEDPAAPVQIRPFTGDFFRQKQPWPEHWIWRAWRGENIPFLFAQEVGQPLFTQKNFQVTLQVDLIAGAFYFLSGWQEYHSAERDQFGRFPYQHSLQYHLGIITIPVVNYYFDLLKHAIELAYRIRLEPAFLPTGTFSTLITHDIDNSASAWKAEGLAALKQGRFGRMFHLVLEKARGRDAWFNWEEVAHQVKQWQAKCTFFFLCEREAWQGTKNADFDIRQPRYQQAVKALTESGAEICLHGSLAAAVNPAVFREEKRRLPVPVLGNRFHYLSFEPRNTPDLLAEAGIAYDSTLGFAEHFGFRHSYCFPFWLFNFKTNLPYPFLEIPLNLMDATLHHPRYLQVPPAEMVATLAPMIAEIKKFGGVFTLLWHNENFSSFNRINGPREFTRLMEHLSFQGSQFHLGHEIHAHFSSALRN